MPKRRGPYASFLINPCCRGSVKGVVTNFQWTDYVGLTERGKSGRAFASHLSTAFISVHSR